MQRSKRVIQVGSYLVCCNPTTGYDMLDYLPFAKIPNRNTPTINTTLLTILHRQTDVILLSMGFNFRSTGVIVSASLKCGKVL